MGMCEPRRGDDLRIVHGAQPRDVLGHGAGEELHVLRQVADIGVTVRDMQLAE